MKKIYATIVCLMSVVAVMASPEYPNVKSARQVSVAPLAEAGESDGVASPPLENEPKWEDIGLCAYTDDVVTTCYSTGAVTYNVRVQKDVANEGMYRIVNPWENYPAAQRKQVEEDEDNPGVLPIGDEYYIMIDARDPERVRIPESHIGMSNKRGEYTMYSLSELVDRFYHVTEEKAVAAYGKLEDGVITFKTKYAFYLIDPTGDYWLGNKHKEFRLVLTGTVIPVDYEFMIGCKQAFCADANGNYQFTIMGDENIPHMRCKVISTYPDEAASIEDVLATGRACYPGQTITVNESVFTDRCMYFMVVACDDKGVLQSARYIDMYATDFNAADWAPLGKADMTEGFLSCLFPTLFDVETFEVDVEYNIKRPNYYRVVNPYDSWEPAKSYLTYGHGHNHYMYIDASEDDKVYFEKSPLGLEMLQYGEVTLCCDYEILRTVWGKDFLEHVGTDKSGGHFENNVITFDETAGVRLFLSNIGEVMTNCFPNPEYDEEAALADPENYQIRPYLPGYFKLDLNKALSGVEGVKADGVDARPEYFNLQGVKVENPRDGLFIRRQGNKVEKVVLK